MIREEMHHLYQKEGGRGIESFEAMTWNYAQPHSPSSVELAKELNGYALADLLDADGLSLIHIFHTPCNKILPILPHFF